MRSRCPNKDAVFIFVPGSIKSLNFSGVPPPVVIERYKYLLLALPPVYLVYDIAKKLIQIREVYVTSMFFMLQSNKCR